MSSYIGKHADLYDIFYDDKPYKQESEFIAKKLDEYGAPGRNMLEIACGTGSHSHFFSSLGWSVVAIDYSPDMIRRAIEKNASSESRVSFIEGDMRKLSDIRELYGKTFDAAVCLFDSIGYTLTNEGVASTLKGLYNTLNDGAVFCLEYWHAAAMINGYSPVRVRRRKHCGGEIIRISETTLETASQTAEISFDILELKEDGSFSRLQEKQRNRYFSIPEMDLFLETAGFSILSRHAGFADDRNIGEGVWHIVCFVKKI